MNVLPDLLDMKKKLIEKKLLLYKKGDGHPLRDGYSAYAKTAVKLLKQMCLQKNNREFC
jgi:hypothetical protein